MSIEDGFSNANVSFSNCKFIGNWENVGGGLAVNTFGGRFDQGTTNITVEIRDSLFERNGYGYANFGGGLTLLFPTYLSSILSY